MSTMTQYQVRGLLKGTKAFHLRAIVSYLGERPDKVANMKVSDCLKFIHVRATSDEVGSAQVRDAVNIIVKKQIPGQTGSSSTPVKQEVMTKEQVYNNVSSIISGQYNERENNLESKYHDLENAIKEVLPKVAKEASTVVRQEAQKYRTVQVKVGKKKAVKLKGVVPEVFTDLLDLGHERRNILMVGPAGSGKTYLGGLIAQALGLDFGSQSCTEGMSESELTGWLLPVGASGKFEYVPSRFVEIYEKGGVFLFDEIDGADPNVLMILNQALANDGFSLSKRYKNPWVKKHPDFVAVAAANTFGTGADATYVGRNQLDAATLDRFKVGTVEIDYDETVERALVNPDVYDWGIKIREKIRANGMQRIMSTRVMIDATTMYENKEWPIEKIEERYFSGWSREERAIVKGGV